MTIRLSALAPPTLPLPGNTYARAYGDSLNNVLRLYFNRINTTVNSVIGNEGGQFLSFPYGSFVDTSSQTAALVDTPYGVKLNTTMSSNSVVLDGVDTSRLIVDEDGLYNFQFSLQLKCVHASDKSIWIWFRVNDTDVPNSTTRVSLRGNTKEAVAAWNFFVPMQALDVFQLMWATDSTDVSLPAQAATAFCPAIPSAIITANFISTLAASA